MLKITNKICVDSVYNKIKIFKDLKFNEYFHKYKIYTISFPRIYYPLRKRSAVHHCIQFPTKK